MIVNNVQLHHVQDIRERADGGKQLLRFPTSVTHRLNEKGRRAGLDSAGCEVRFVTPAPVVWVTVGSVAGESEVIVYCGPFQHSRHPMTPGVQKTLVLERPPRLATIQADAKAGFAFSPDVWRVVFSRQVGIFYGVESFGHPVRPPEKSELPKRTWLAYGSSITHSNAYDGYAHQAARRMGVDLLNCGFGGSCHCESAMADHLATRGDWDLATMELGINMRNQFSRDEFRELAGYLIRTMVEKNPDKPIAVITHYPSEVTFADEPSRLGENELAFDDISRQIVAELKHPKLRIIEGRDVMSRYDGHTVDLVHPGQLGHAMMGENLARILSDWPAVLR